MAAGRELADGLVGLVSSLLDGLDVGQRRDAMLPFDDGERRTWAYWPTQRRGVALHRLDRAQSKAVHVVLGRLLPLPVLAQVTTIMGLDEVLDVLEGHAGSRRHRDDYWITVFGSPGPDPWAFRFEGHHVSLHVTVVDGEVAVLPLFLGANPAEVHHRQGPAVAPLAVEERLGFELYHHLTVEQRSAALLSDEAPADIVTRNDPAIDALDSGGVPLSALSGAAATAATELLSVYLDRFAPGVRRPDPSGAVFAWCGATEPGIGHYYRVSSPRLLVELDNTQNGANHVHTVVRDPAGDFGGDVLAHHHRHGHR